MQKDFYILWYFRKYFWEDINIFDIFTECADGYDQLINGSDYCYKIVTKKETWQSAKEKCANENAELACFGNEMERDLLASKCDGCWVGYQWQGGKLQLK